MSEPGLDETPRRILEFICRWLPESDPPQQYESRTSVCGELRLALHEYDEACGVLLRRRLIVTDQPYSHDADQIAPTPAGRAWVRARRG